MITSHSSPILRILFFSILIVASVNSFSQAPQNWTKEQLMEPAQLAERLNAGDTSLLIISVGPGALIPHSVTIKPVQDKENLAKLKQQLEGVNRDAGVVIYCGCCPFEHCPNVRPAIDLLNQMKFTNFRLLNLSHNMKADWLDKGYPRVKL
jgi:hypothetical protein